VTAQQSFTRHPKYSVELRPSVIGTQRAVKGMCASVIFSCANRQLPTSDRERVMQVLQDRGLLCQLPTERGVYAQPLTVEELDRLATKPAQGGPLSELIIQECRGEG